MTCLIRCSAAEANEAFKIAIHQDYLNNYMMYNGLSGAYSYTFEYEKKETCPVCGTQETTYRVSPELKLQELMELLAGDAR